MASTVPAEQAAMAELPSRAAAWGRLAVATAIAAAGAALLFAFFWFLPVGDAQFSAFANWFYRHSALLIAAALSPLLASLLVGYGYMSRAVRRRAAERAAGRAGDPSRAG